MALTYIVTSGTYSDYSIEGVFTNRDLAQMYIDAFGGGHQYVPMRIEEYPLNHLEHQIRQGLLPHFVRVDIKGVVSEVSREKHTYAYHDRLPSVSYTYNNSHMNVHCLAKDDLHAASIGRECYREAIDKKTWGMDFDIK